ncbi:MAG: AAA domain-containing protein [Candidatus Lokiarchaeota archaeon]|nr:AAA domain-containing protein [Candidatus Lokiarchaeota archaeon]
MLNKNIDEATEEFKQRFNIIGRSREIRQAILARLSNKNILIEGQVGVGKTTLSRSLAEFFDQNFYRIDGDERFTETKLVGYFDPPQVLKLGYNTDSFFKGPLTSAMKNGGILFINELNRLPERSQNVLLSSLDEGILEIPKLGLLKAEKGFTVIATINPSEHVGVGLLGEAIKDRFVWIHLDYQSFEEEIKITQLRTECKNRELLENAVKIVRLTRDSIHLRRGASVRAAIDMVSILKNINSRDKIEINDWLDVATMSLVPKIDLEDGVDKPLQSIIENIVSRVIASAGPR